MEKRAIIIGSGLGGLECSLILARNGYKVTILEKASQPGGCLQSFTRGGRLFDTGFHYAPALGEGEPLNRLFRYFGLLDLPWRKLDPDCADEIWIDGRSFPLATGPEHFAERLAESFPSEREALHEYASFLSGVSEGIFKAFGPEAPLSGLFGRGAEGYLRSQFRDPLLRQVLCGTSLRFELRDNLPLYMFAQIGGSFMLSSWKLIGGGRAIVDRLVDQIEALGGEVRTGSEVTGIHVVDGKAGHVEVGGSECLPADLVISDAHPAVTMGLVSPGSIRQVYKDRISTLPNTFGVFTANILLKPGALDYQNRNIFVHGPAEGCGSSDASLRSAPPLASLAVPPLNVPRVAVPSHAAPFGWTSIMIHYYPIEEGSKATHLDLISPMDVPPQRGEAYEDVKRHKLEECLDLASVAIPGLRDAIDKVWTSTPLTYSRYTGTPGGSAFGIRKDWRNPLGTILSPRTPLENLFLTGQSLNLHGLLGVSMTSILTCRQILGEDFLSL